MSKTITIKIHFPWTPKGTSTQYALTSDANADEINVPFSPRMLFDDREGVELECRAQSAYFREYGFTIRVERIEQKDTSAPIVHDY